jgi:hypothetical protein
VAVRRNWITDGLNRSTSSIAGEQRQVVAHLLELVRVLRQRQHRVGEQVARRVVAGDHQELEEPVQLVVGEVLAVDLRVHDGAPQVVGGLAAALFGGGPRVGEHLGEGGEECLRVGAVLGVVEAHEPVGPAVEQRAILGRHAKHVGQHEQRHLGCDVGEIVGLPRFADGVDDFAGMAVDGVGQLTADGLGGEGAVDDLAQ